MTRWPITYQPRALARDPDVVHCVTALLTMYATSGPAAVDALRPVLDPSFTFTPAGTGASALQRTYVGPDGFAEFLARQAALTDHSWWPEVQSIHVEVQTITADVVAHPRRRDGVRARFGIVHEWTRRGGRLVSFHSHTTQQREYDRFHAHDASFYGR